ncbi:MAG: sodium-dependent bicarbonate transport family permease [Hoeflea sp.]|nr:sodium-dependent bicarbonate transport family permease [Hoeflea sp.]MBU4528328.1 sodium-dependent bicarbonate transport family permease [Alphaproteobacteria bacterium]MBU4542997.1 sodium-dependent bicarbonate transport family permease [Alphaproteobacteria bacterium]MBU4551688.1 sodium-dependent bicarbonate transport family permease [Alphaproteobacteria bacterium]MBV1723583.1 sodium-dependent bicarbonate transport family permease [Hoeflea sp.]MBV1761899.1 sodium-dependent bicarbonate transpo
MQDILALATANLLSPAVLFFALGFLGTMAGSQLTLPEAVAKTLSIYLMLAIGFKGGVAVAEHGLGIDIALALIAGVVLSASIPLVAFGLLTVMARLDRVDRAAVAAHYGSISIVTFVAASEALRLAGLSFEGYLVAVAAVMETPAILVALYLAHSGGTPSGSPGKAGSGGESLMSEVMLNSSVVVLVGSFVIGYLSGPKGLADIGPFIVDPFKGVLCLFLLDMGAVAGRGIRSGWKHMSPGLVAFGLIMPYVGAALALLAGLAIGLSTGGVALLMVLGASASYIAVPAALRLALPQARPSIYLTLSLGITFPMNLTIGIPAYIAIAQMTA